MSVSVSLVLPVLDGEAYLERTLPEAWAWLSQHGGPSELVVVDDGSRDATPQILERFGRARSPDEGSRFVRIVNQVNRGKGYSVRRGLRAATGALRLFSDADLTYPPQSLTNVVRALRNGAEIAVACRVHEDSRYVVAPDFFRYICTRHNAGRIFNLLVRGTLATELRDTQAGLKGFRAHVVDELFDSLTFDRFSFDVELLYLAKKRGYRIEEVPVTYLYRKEPSTIRFARDTIDMCVDVLRIRLRDYGEGVTREDRRGDRDDSAPRSERSKQDP